MRKYMLTTYVQTENMNLALGYGEYDGIPLN
jgi:hypothetical protein